jgi:hypothetical protein
MGQIVRKGWGILTNTQRRYNKGHGGVTMTFEELLREVDKLSDDELRVLRERIARA